MGCSATEEEDYIGYTFLKSVLAITGKESNVAPVLN
jgi:hypothetical protein